MTDNDLSVTVLADARSDRLGMATVVRASGNTYFFDCRGIDAVPAAAIATQSTRALFVTNPASLTEPDIIRLLDGAVGQEAPLHVWGPAGTREWLQRRYPEVPGTREDRQPSVVDIRGGVISEAGLHVTAIPIGDDTFAYRVQSEKRILVIASNVKHAEQLAGSLGDIDLAVLRHSNAPEVLRLFDQTRPRQLWIVPDGVPISVAQVRESYGGSFEVVDRRLRRAVAPPTGAAPSERR
jgi:hypothetical protein